jgi:glyoxylase-like metal-dependent hydrolase (beta-lactamase superfamily II)
MRVTACFLLLAPLFVAKVATSGAVIPITPSVSLVRGPVNGVLLRRHGRTLAVYGDPRKQAVLADKVLFTHHRRDVVWAGAALVRGGAEAVVPAAEEQLFTGVRRYWENFPTGRFKDLSQQTTKVLTGPLAKVTAVRGGETIDWEGIQIRVLDTPGYTRGAVSYVIEIDGKRIACTGDLIYGDGRILDLYSLQGAIPEAKEDAYHGCAARAADVIRSLREIARWKPDLVVPTRGPVIEDPQAAINRLVERLRAVFASHFTIDALRWYRGDDSIRIQAARVLGEQPVDWMPPAETAEKLPDWIIPIANSRLIVSRSGAAFLVDCGSKRIIQELKKLQQEGRFKKIDGIYVTHYHSDHTDQVAAAAEEFHCPVIACAEMRDILERPPAYHMTVQTANAIRNVRATGDGQKQRWNEFEFTYCYLPGQTLYHGGLLVAKTSKVEGPRSKVDDRGNAEPVFFIGDSFTPTGIDDYCLLNRNFMEPEQGFAYCLRLLKRLPPRTLLINQHVGPAFRFSEKQIEQMLGNLEHRRRLLRDLFPWDEPNFGLDEQWARFYPYQAETAAGKAIELQVAVLNHSARSQEFRITPHVPAGWKLAAVPLRVLIPAREERAVRFSVTPPPDASGIAIITADVAFDEWDLRDWSEAIIAVRPE